MMLGLLLISLPIILSISLILRPHVPFPIWFVLIATFTLLEIMFLGTAGNYLGLKQIITESLLMVVIPWGLVAVYLRLMRHSSRPVVIGIGTLFVYFLSMGIGLLTGDMSGLIPQ
jgi:hypothetical protein